MTIFQMIVLRSDDEICHFDAFFEFASTQPDITGPPGYGIANDGYIIYSSEQGWVNIWTLWVKTKLNDGWVFLQDGRLAAPKGHPDHEEGYWQWGGRTC